MRQSLVASRIYHARATEETDHFVDYHTHMFDLTADEERLFKKLNSPILIQNYLDKLPMNHEKSGHTHYSPRKVLKKKKAQCIEGAMLAAAILWYHGQQPLLMDLVSHEQDDDHVIALYKKNGYWGAISKTNHPGLRFRDPVYKTVRELAVSYFHEWFFYVSGEKTLVSYSDPVNLKKLGLDWVTTEKGLWHIDGILDKTRHHRIYPRTQKKFIRNATKIERDAASRIEWPRSNPQT